jgi:hypothetical protein
VDTIGFGSDREPRHWRPGWRPPRPWARRRAWLVAAAAAAGVATAAAVLAAAVLATAGGPARRPVSAPASAVPWPPPLLRGVPAHGIGTDLFLAGENFLRVTAQPRQVAAGFLVNGLSPLLPPGHGAEADQLAPVPGGVVAHISDISNALTYGALGRVVFIPAANAPAQVIARATMIAVSPDGRRVWVQTAVQSLRHGEGVPAGFRSPTWAVNLAGDRVSPVLQLPFGLVAATEAGPLTQNLASGQLQLWNGATGQPIRMSLPAAADFIAAGRDRVVWDACSASCRLHVTDLATGADAAVPLPGNWLPVSVTYPPPSASFDPSGQRLVLPLDRVDSSGNATAEALFIASTATKTLRMIPGTELSFSSLPASQPIQMIGAWDQQGLLWVLASSPDEGYYQLGYWTGAGPLRTFGPARGGPVALTAPGPG